MNGHVCVPGLSRARARAVRAATPFTRINTEEGSQVGSSNLALVYLHHVITLARPFSLPRLPFHFFSIITFPGLFPNYLSLFYFLSVIMFSSCYSKIICFLLFAFLGRRKHLMLFRFIHSCTLNSLYLPSNCYYF